MRCLFPLLLCCLAFTACNRGQPVQPATPMPTAAASASSTVDGVTLHTSTANIADLNAAMAQRYGIDRAQDGLLLLVTVRDAHGNGIEPGDLQLAATASALPDPPRPLPLRAIQTGGMTDYIGVFNAAAPASVQFKLTASRGGSRADIATSTELYPR